MAINHSVHKTTRTGLAIATILLLFVGCSDRSYDHEPELRPGVLATVNGDAITEQDVEHTLARTFSQESVAAGSDVLRDKLLDSLIASRAMKQLVLQEMEASEIESIQAKVRAYEEELYVQSYLERHIVPRPVTGEMVRAYYEQHPEQFGSETIRRFELLLAPANLDEQREAALLADVPGIRAHSNWSERHTQWSQEYGLQLQQGRSRPGLLHSALDRALEQLEEGETSPVVYIDGQLHLIRLIDIQHTPPKALAEVRDEIRQKLAPLHLREAVKEASDHARAQAQVERIGIE